MIHSMGECIKKLRLIKDMARIGTADCERSESAHRFSQIEAEVSYLIKEAEDDLDKIRNDQLRSYRID